MKCIYVHGFLGESTQTFKDFHRDLVQKVAFLQASPLLYNHDSHGNNAEQVQNLIRFIQNNHKNEDLILMGHSMGGLLCADAALALSPTVSIKGVYAFDSPFFGLAPRVLESGTQRLSSAAEKWNQTLQRFLPQDPNRPSTSQSSTWLGLAASLATVATVGYSAYQSLDKESQSQLKSIGATHAQKALSSIKGKMSFLGPLWDIGNMQARMEKIHRNSGFDFHCFYTHLRNQTFIQSPWPSFAFLFTPIPYTQYHDEIDVHMNMFDSKDAGYSILIQQTVRHLNKLF